MDIEGIKQIQGIQAQIERERARARQGMTAKGNVVREGGTPCYKLPSAPSIYQFSKPLLKKFKKSIDNIGN